MPDGPLQTHQAEAERDALRVLCAEVARSGVAFTDERVKYVEVQIDRDTWDQLQRLRRQHMQRTASRVAVRVGEEKHLIHLTDSAVEAVQEEANGKLIDALNEAYAVSKTVEGGESFASLDLNQLLEMRDGLSTALSMVEVLIECCPLDELESDDADA